MPLPTNQFWAILTAISFKKGLPSANELKRQTKQHTYCMQHCGMQFYLNCPILGTTTSCNLNCRCSYNHAARYQSKYSFTYSILFYMLAWQPLYLLCLWWLIKLKIIHGLHHLSMFLLIARGFSGFMVFSCILLGSAFFLFDTKPARICFTEHHFKISRVDKVKTENWYLPNVSQLYWVRV